MSKENILAYLDEMRVDRVFPYLPFIIKPNLKIAINDEALREFSNLEYCDLSSEIRLFPQGVTVVHLKAYFKAPFTADDLVELQRKFKYQKVLVLDKSETEKLGLENDWNYINDFFSAIGKTVLKTVYKDKVGLVDESARPATCRLVNPLAEFVMTNEVLASLTTLSRNPKDNEIKEAVKDKLGSKKTKDPTDVIAYHDYALLLYVPKNTERETDCLRSNCTSVIELAFLQDTFLSRIINQFDEHKIWDSYEKQKYLFDLNCSAFRAVLYGFPKHRQTLNGIHKSIYLLVSNKSKHENKENEILAVEEYYDLEKGIKEDLEKPQEYLETIIKNSYEGKFEGGLLNLTAVRDIQDMGATLISDINAEVSVIRAEKRRTRPDYSAISRAMGNIGRAVDVTYKMDYLLRYKNLVKELLEKEEQIKEKADTKRQSDKDAPDEKKVEELLKTAKEKMAEADKKEADIKKEKFDKEKPKSFFEKAKPYLGAIVTAASSVLKALGYL